MTRGIGQKTRWSISSDCSGLLGQSFLNIQFFFYLFIFLPCVPFKLSSEERKKESKVAQSCPTLCNPVDCSLPGSSVHGILQARILEWVAISFSRGSSWLRDQTQVSRIAGRCLTLWTTREAPTSDSGVKNSPVVQGTRVWPLVWEDPQSREWLPTPVFLPRESHGKRSLEGYSPWGHKESDTTVWQSLHYGIN